MCLNLIGSKYESIDEVEFLLTNRYVNVTEEKILEMKDNRAEIDRQLVLIESQEYIDELGI